MPGSNDRHPASIKPVEGITAGSRVAPSLEPRTIRIALVVGLILSLINQGNVIIGGDATALTWVKVGLNFTGVR